GVYCDGGISDQGRCVMLIVQVFVYLQLLDFLTTMVGFRLGAHEVSPFIVKLIHSTTPAIGVAASKVVGLAIGGLCIASGRVKLLSLANYWYAALVVWNLAMILTAAGKLG
ncbi:MAG TPA: hypothetical protein VHC72_07105, partial [Bryobacteraceae bacterium]|nr:hypothetical protein [Bryobacteraceae bacterium]